MIRILKNHYKVSLTLATFFILGMAASLFAIYSLPSSLHLSDGYQPEFINVYVVIAITFLLGGLGLVLALRYKKEVVIFRDRAIEAAAAKKQEADKGKTTISLEGVNASLDHAKTKKEILEAGLATICKQIEAGQGAIYTANEKDGKRTVELQGGYALSIAESTTISYEFGEGLIGQAAASGQSLYVDDVPEGYIKIVSGLGSASPKNLLIVALKHEGQVLGVMEIASFTPISEDQRKFTEESAQLIADKIYTKAS
ncbi:GAF domain-containing protein [Chryseolinea sp. H1M3-3]|uniref:GAF domain-containing protein n=1 Tax=Chryseolinea sp. H1M3-3 TaxID=3034144 RepID=UPI0023EA99D5|nr:GAF domain-containing protein [Chryseolinea sp. H1M3-3]